MKQCSQVAIKFEKKSARCPQLRHEFKVYREMQGCEGIGRVLYYGSYRDCNVMVMELLGPSLEDLFNKCGRKFSLRTTLRLADQLLERVDGLHENHLIHRDIKPANFVMGLGGDKGASTVFCIDFGLSKRYRHPHTLQHIPYKEGRSLTGTPRYASVANHRGIETSRRDDLESIGYILVYFLLGKLPWQGLKLPANVQGTASQKHQLILDKKQLTSLGDLCRGCPKEFQEYLQYCRELQFDAKPDVAYLRGIFRKLATSQGFDNLPPAWDWDKAQKSIVPQKTSSSSTPAAPVVHQRPQSATPEAQRAAVDADPPKPQRAKSAIPGHRSSDPVLPQQQTPEPTYTTRPQTPSGIKTYHSSAAVGGAQSTARPWTAQSTTTTIIPTTTKAYVSKESLDYDEHPTPMAQEDDDYRPRGQQRPISSRDQVIISYARGSSSSSTKKTDRRTDRDVEEKTPRPLTAPTAASSSSKRAWRFLEGDDDNNDEPKQQQNFATAAAAARDDQAWGESAWGGTTTAPDQVAAATTGQQQQQQRHSDGVDYFAQYRYGSYGSHFSGTPLSLVRHRRSMSRSGARPHSGNAVGYRGPSNGGLQATGYNLHQTTTPNANKTFWGPQQVRSRPCLSYTSPGEPTLRLAPRGHLPQPTHPANERCPIRWHRPPLHETVIRPDPPHVLGTHVDQKKKKLRRRRRRRPTQKKKILSLDNIRTIRCALLCDRNISHGARPRYLSTDIPTLVQAPFYAISTEKKS